MTQLSKSNKESLAEQIFDILVHEIRTGILKPGAKLMGYRKLAKRFGVSWGTVIEALDRLESENYIKKMSGSGTYINPDINYQLQTVKIAFASTAESLAIGTGINPENWRRISESYRGIVSETANHNAEVSYIHFELSSDDIIISRQLKRLEAFDAVIFMSQGFNKLNELFMKSGKPCVMLEASEASSGKNLVVSDVPEAFADMAEFASRKTYKKLRIISPVRNNACEIYKFNVMSAAESFNNVGIISGEDYIYELNKVNFEELEKILDNNSFELKNNTEVFYLESPVSVPLFYRYCQKHNLVPGKDLGVFGYGDGIAFNNLLPEFTYSRINFFGRGQRACGRIIEEFCSGKSSHQTDFVDNILVKGASL